MLRCLSVPLSPLPAQHLVSFFKSYDGRLNSSAKKLVEGWEGGARFPAAAPEDTQAHAIVKVGAWVVCVCVGGGGGGGGAPWRQSPPATPETKNQAGGAPPPPPPPQHGACRPEQPP